MAHFGALSSNRTQFSGKDCVKVKPTLSKDGNWVLPIDVFNKILTEGEHGVSVPVVAKYETPNEIKCRDTGKKSSMLRTSSLWKCPFQRCSARFKNTVKVRTDHVCLHLLNNECLREEKGLKSSGRMCCFCGSRSSDCRIVLRKNSSSKIVLCKARLGPKHGWKKQPRWRSIPVYCAECDNGTSY